MNRTGVTIVDIARELGISKTAVSSALHGSGRVSESTRQRVLAQAAAMGYVSNRAAQKLRGGAHGAIGLHIPSDVWELSFYMEFAFGVADVTAETGNDLLLLTGFDAPPGGRRAGIDGLLALDPMPTGFGSVLDLVDEIPVVTVGDYEGPERDRILARIYADHGNLVREVLDALLRGGMVRPALIGLEADREPLWASQVVGGYLAWCRDTGCDPSVTRLPVTPTDAEMLQTLDGFARDGVDSIVWVGQGLALRALTLDRDTDRAPRFRPKMATMAAEPRVENLLGIDLRAREYGRAAARLLLRAIAGGTEPDEHVLHEGRLVE